MVSEITQIFFHSHGAYKYLSTNNWAEFFYFAENFMSTQAQSNIENYYFDTMHEICRIAQEIEPRCFEFAGFLPSGAILKLDLLSQGLVLSDMVNIKSIHKQAIYAPYEAYISLPPDIIEIEPQAIYASKSIVTLLYPGTKEEFEENLKDKLNCKSNKIYNIICDDNYIYEPTR